MRRQATPGLTTRELLALLPPLASLLEVGVPVVHLTVQPRTAVMDKAVLGRAMKARAQPVVLRKLMVREQRLIERLVVSATASRVTLTLQWKPRISYARFALQRSVPIGWKPDAPLGARALLRQELLQPQRPARALLPAQSSAALLRVNRVLKKGPRGPGPPQERAEADEQLGLAVRTCTRARAWLVGEAGRIALSQATEGAQLGTRAGARLGARLGAPLGGRGRVAARVPFEGL